MDAALEQEIAGINWKLSVSNPNTDIKEVLAVSQVREKFENWKGFKKLTKIIYILVKYI